MIDPKVKHLRGVRDLLFVDVIAGDVTHPQALAELHRICDMMWPPAVIKGKVANP